MCIKEPYPNPVIRKTLNQLKDCLIEAGKPIIERYVGHIKSYFGRKDRTNGKEAKADVKNH